MNIEYKYKIINVNEEARCMEIIYEATDRETMHIGARLPYVGEELESIVIMYAPIQYWLEKELSVQVPEVGISGVISPPPEPSQSDLAIVEQPVVEGAQTL